MFAVEVEADIILISRHCRNKDPATWHPDLLRTTTAGFGMRPDFEFEVKVKRMAVFRFGV